MAVWMYVRKLGVALSTLCLLLVLASSRVAAHAYLVATSPAVNATVTSPLREVTLVYNEPVRIDGSSAIAVHGKDGATYPCVATAHVDPNGPTHVVCTLREPLERGTYTVSWQAISADKHVVQGTFAFGIGVPVFGSMDEARAGALRSWNRFRDNVHRLSDEPIYLLATPEAIGLRWLLLTGIALLVGALGFERLVLAGRDFQGDVAAAVLRRRCRWLCMTGAALALCASLAGAIVVPAALITKVDAANTAWLLRIGLLCVVLIATLNRRLRPLAYLAAILLPICLSLSANAAEGGHDDDDGIIHTVADWLHACAAALYAGGLVVFALAIRPALAVISPEARPEFLRRVIACFSRVAIIAVATIVISGVYAAIQHVGSFALLFGTLYGQIILAKVLLLVPLLAFGYVHNRQGRGRSAGRFFTASVSGEAAIAVAILGLAALLVGFTPPG